MDCNTPEIPGLRLEPHVLNNDDPRLKLMYLNLLGNIKA